MSEKNTGGPAFPCVKCGVQFCPKDWQIKSRDMRCLPCKRLQQNAANAAKGEKLKEEARAAYQRRREYYLSYQANPERRFIRAARRKVATEIEAGRLTREPCVVCGEKQSEAHHDDYDKPLNIVWLCRRHHMDHHLMLKARES